LAAALGTPGETSRFPTFTHAYHYSSITD
jgi:hypothetical protein